MNQRPKLWYQLGPRSLYLANNLLLTFTSKAHNILQGVFPTMIGFVTLAWPPFLHDSLNKRWPRVTKPIMVGKTPCKLLCAFEVKVSNKLLAIYRYKLLGPSWYQSFRSLIHSQTSWIRAFSCWFFLASHFFYTCLYTVCTQILTLICLCTGGMYFRRVSSEP